MEHFYLLRHGQTDMNIEHRLQGRSDTPLNQTGMKQAEKMLACLKEHDLLPDVIYSSPLQRARRTAEILSEGRARIVVSEKLIEMSFGENETKRMDELTGSFDYSFFSHPEEYEPPAGGESYTEVLNRMGGFIADLKKEDPKGRVFVMTHGAALHAMISYIKKARLEDYWRENVYNLALLKITPGTEKGSYEVLFPGYE